MIAARPTEKHLSTSSVLISAILVIAVVAVFWAVIGPWALGIGIILGIFLYPVRHGFPETVSEWYLFVALGVACCYVAAVMHRCS